MQISLSNQKSFDVVVQGLETQMRQKKQLRKEN